MDDLPAGPSVRFRLTEADYLAFLKERQVASPWFARLQVVLLAVILVALFAVHALMIARGERLHAKSLLVVGAIAIAWPLLLVHVRRSELGQARKLGIFDEDITVSLTDDGLSISDMTGRGLTRWDFVVRVDSRPSAVHVVYKNGATLVIPRTAFATPGAAEEFVAWVRTRIR